MKLSGIKRVREAESMQRRWKKVSASVFSESNQPCLSASTLSSTKSALTASHAYLWQEKQPHTHTHMQPHKEYTFTVHRRGTFFFWIDDQGWSNASSDPMIQSTDIIEEHCLRQHSDTLRILCKSWSQNNNKLNETLIFQSLSRIL